MRYLFLLLLIACSTANGQDLKHVDKGVLATGGLSMQMVLQKTDIDEYSIEIKKGRQYQFKILQQGIDVTVKLLAPGGKQLVEKDSPNGTEGPENFDLTATETGKYTLLIVPFADSTSAPKGRYSISLRELTKEQIKRKKLIRKELAGENAKNVLTLDIDHFWDAYDHLAQCKTFKDSVESFQERYIDKATDGLIDFIEARNFTAEEYAVTVRRLPKFYQSIRPNTFEVKKAVPLIEEVFVNFQKLYPEFKPFKVCFAIGTVRTGGTTSDKFVLIGTEITTCTRYNDLSEFGNSAMGKVLAGDTNIVQKIKNIVAHECVHTQQKNKLDSNAEKCDLLYACLLEGPCDFIGELIAGNQINKVAQEYGDAHEVSLWEEFKKEMCSSSLSNWLYNYSTAKDKPADLGYYIGYRIAKSYYNNHTDKKQAIIDILEMKDPKKFLELSGYDPK